MIEINILEYAQKELSKFEENEFCEVDSLVLSQLSYMFFDTIVGGINEKSRPIKIKDTYMLEHMPDMLNTVRLPEENKKLLCALSGNPRFRDIKMNWYVNEVDSRTEKQFSAVCFILDRKTAYVAFRGTDASFVGWKEDFNMAFMERVPAQEQAAEYLNYVSKKLPRSLIVGGHSKGGNLAVYAATECRASVQKRIKAVYCHDGPGFKAGFLEKSRYKSISDRVFKTVPQSSIIGMLLDNQQDYTVIKSNRTGIMQHDPYSWQIENGGFIELEDVNKRAKLIDKTLSNWLDSLSQKERERFVEVFFRAVKPDDAATVFDFENIKFKDIKSVIELTGSLEPSERKFLSDNIKEIIKLSIKFM